MGGSSRKFRGGDFSNIWQSSLSWQTSVFPYCTKSWWKKLLSQILGGQSPQSPPWIRPCIHAIVAQVLDYLISVSLCSHNLQCPLLRFTFSNIFHTQSTVLVYLRKVLIADFIFKHANYDQTVVNRRRCRREPAQHKASLSGSFVPVSQDKRSLLKFANKQ